MTRSSTGRRHAGRSAGVGLTALALAALTAAGCSSSSSSSTSTPASPASGAASTSAAAAGASASGTPFMVGAMGTFTGVASGSTGEAKTVFQDWVSATNAAGGINGHPVQAVILDDQNNPSTALSNAQQLVQQDHVKVIFDLSDNLESSFAKVVDTAKVPVLELLGELKAASLAKVTKIGALYCAEIASCAETVPLFTTLGPTTGVHLAYSAKVSSTASSYTAQCLGAKNSAANGVTVGAASDVALRVAESCSAQGYKPVWVSTAGEMTTTWLSQPAVNGATGSVQDVPWFDNSIPATQAMQAAISKYSPSVLTSASFGATATIGWAAGTVFATVAKTANLTPDSSQTAIIAGLDTVKNNTYGGITPPLTSTAGKAAQVPCSFVAGISNGKWTEPIGLKTICMPGM